MNMNTRIKDDNRGIALLSVLIAIMLCFLLSATIMRVSFLSLLSRNIDTASAETFYTAESVVDDIRINLQKVAAIAVSVSGAEDAGSFVNTVYNTLTQFETGDPTHTEVQRAEAYIKQNVTSDAVVTINGEITKGSDYVLITDVNIVYTDPTNGHVSNITTDLRIRAPYFASSEEHPLGSYSFFAGGGANISNGGGVNPNEWGNFEQAGNIYIGYITYDESTKIATACNVHNYMNVTFSGDNVVINGDVYITDYSTLAFLGKVAEIRGTIYISNNSHLVLGENTYVLAQDIVVDGKSVLKNEYQCTNTNEYSNGLPQVCAVGQKRDYIDQAASVVRQNGSKCYNVVCTNGVFSGTEAIDLQGAITELYPRPNVEKNGKYYDEKFVEVVDMDYFGEFSKCGSVDYKEPRGKLGSGAFEYVTGNKIKVNALTNVGTTHSSMALASGNMNVKVCMGTNIEVNNGGAAVVLGSGDYTVAMNGSSNNYYGIYMSVGTVTFKHTGNCAQGIGRSLLDADTSDNKQYVKAYLDDLGTHWYYAYGLFSNIDDYKYIVVNNFFNGGIKSLYDGGAGDSSESSKDYSVNQSLELIGIENWNKK